MERIILVRSKSRLFLAESLSCSVAGTLFFDPGYIFPGPSIDGYLCPFFDKGWDAKDIACFKRDRFAVSGYGITLDPGICLGHDQIHKIGQGNPDGPLIKKKDVHFQVVDQAVLGISDLIGLKDGLFIK